MLATQLLADVQLLLLLHQGFICIKSHSLSVIMLQAPVHISPLTSTRTPIPL
jgi:hypothetical protein